MSKIILWISLGLILLMLSSCMISRHPTAILSSSKPITPDYVVLKPVEDSSCSPWFLLIPLSGQRDADEIIAALIQENGADALVGVTVETQESLFSLPIMGTECIVVKGQAVKTTGG